jgi:Bacteriocin-protection, YdeI or OmpD-Associated/Domain of unknown function (DUF1905)
MESDEGAPAGAPPSSTFRTTVELFTKTGTGLRVPTEVVARLGSGKRPPVRVTIGGYTYRSTVAAYGDEYFLPLNAGNRERAGVAAGDQVDVDVDLDTAPREVTVPSDLAAALDDDAEARRSFDGLSYSHKREYVSWIEEAKRDETRRRRIAKAVDMLRAGETRP